MQVNENTNKGFRGWLKVIRSNIGITLFLVLISELIFGNWIFGSDFGMMNIPRNMKKVIDTKQFQLDKDAVYTRDEFGLRGNYGGNPANIDIVALGGSTTNERFITDGETWVDVLGKTLHEFRFRKTVVNAGAEGQSSVGHIHNFDAWFPEIPGFRPKYFIAYIGINDIEVDDERNLLLTHAKYDIMEYTELFRRVRQYMLNHSAIYRLYKTVTGHIKARRAKITHRAVTIPNTNWNKAKIPTPRFDLKEKELIKYLDNYEERVGILIRRIRDWGAKAVVVNQVRADWRMRNGEVYGQGTNGANIGLYVSMTLFNRRAMKACEEAKAICIDLATKLEFQNGDFYDLVHTTPKGSAKIGAFIARELAPYLRD